MSTTIQVSEPMLQRLKLAREQFEVETYEELLKVLLKKATKPTKSMYGAGGKIDRDELMKDLRDKSDRY